MQIAFDIVVHVMFERVINNILIDLKRKLAIDLDTEC